MQIGFDLDWTDPRSGQVVPWATPEPSMLDALERAPWRVIDVETTELNQASEGLRITNRDARRGVDSRPRLRVLSALFPEADGRLTKVGFDFDQQLAADRRYLCDAAMSRALINHHAGFDCAWMGTYTKRLPERVLDSMLIARVMYPRQLLTMAEIAQSRDEDPDRVQYALSVFEQGRAGWSLADLAFTVLGRRVDKKMQKARNWCEPFLTLEAYEYATNDTQEVYDLLSVLLNREQGEDLLEAYDRVAAGNDKLRLVEPQVLDVLRMRNRGMPWSVPASERYVQAQREKVRKFADELIELEPSLKPLHPQLADFDVGISSALKVTLGDAFRARGLVLDVTEKTAEPKIGEKDLKRSLATQTPAAKPLFAAWAGLCRAKKAGQMSQDFSGYAQRSPDGRIHSNIGHGPATGRLAAKDPNVQQSPRDQAFREAVEADTGHKIVASDYSALDMRVAAGLAIRAQQQIHEVYGGKRQVGQDVRLIVKRVYDGDVTLAQAERMEADAARAVTEWKLKRDAYLDEGARRQYWDRWRELGREFLLARFRRTLGYVRVKAKEAGTPEWGSLRDAFSIPGMDIHTWTAMSMQGKDPLNHFKGMDGAQVAAELKVQKKALGDARQSGKVANLSLTYYMQAAGFQHSAASVHDIHWTIEEANEIRTKWLATYVEIDLWHAWTELNAVASVYVPDPERGGRNVRKPVFASRTLADRVIYAFGVNAALAYEDQSTGADILGVAMQRFKTQFPEVEACLVNQVHDEIVFEVPDEHVERYTEIISQVMTESAEQFLGPFGVRGECSPAIGQFWIKD